MGINFLSTAPALSKTYKVEIHQNFPQKTSATTICNEEDKICFMTLMEEANAKTSHYLDVAMTFDSGTAYFQFMKNREYLMVSDYLSRNFALVLDENAHAKGNAKLYSHRRALTELTADLDITIAPAQ